jgi:hypothetical protein
MGDKKNILKDKRNNLNDKKNKLKKRSRGKVTATCEAIVMGEIVTCAIKNGMVIYQGDIEVGPVDQVRKEYEDHVAQHGLGAIVIDKEKYIWGNEVPYE